MPSYFKINSGGFGPPSYYGYDMISITGYIRDEFNRIINEGNYRINYDPNFSGFGILNKKETNKMEAKKCDRCGKLYEMPGACEDIGAKVRFKHMYISGAEDMSDNKIAEKQTKGIYIKTTKYDGESVDLCHDCRKSLKKWFEGADKEDKKV